MKMSRRVHWWKALLAMLAIVMILDAAALLFAFVRNREILTNAVDMAETYHETGVLPDIGPHIITSTILFNAQEQIEDEKVFGLNYINYRGFLQPYIHKVKAGEICRTIGIYRNIYNGKRGIAAIAGVPVTGSEKTLFRVRKIADLDTVILYDLIFAGVYLLTMVYYDGLAKQRIQAEKIQRQYIANVSHELKSPIASILLLAGNLNEGIVSDEETCSRYYNLIINEAKKLNHTVTEMLDLSRIQVGKMDFTKSSERVADIFAEVLEKYEILCDDIGVSFQKPEDMEQLPPVYTNRERAAQLLEILINNATKFVDEEGLVAVSTERKGSRLLVRVYDDGIIIPREDQKHLFERFYMQDLAHNSSGSGLGLAIAKEVAAGLGEELWIESEEGKGTSFFFTLELLKNQA